MGAVLKTLGTVRLYGHRRCRWGGGGGWGVKGVGGCEVACMLLCTFHGTRVLWMMTLNACVSTAVRHVYVV